MYLDSFCAWRNREDGKSKKEEARTRRALSRGTAKRLSKKHAKPRPFGRARSVLRRAGKFAVFGIARSRSYAKLLIKYFSR